MNVVVILAIPHEEDDILDGATHIHGVYNSLSLFYDECQKRNLQMSSGIDGHYYDKHYYYVEQVFFVQGTIDGEQE